MGFVATQKYSVLSETSPRSNNVLAKTQWAGVIWAITGHDHSHVKLKVHFAPYLVSVGEPPTSQV